MLGGSATVTLPAKLAPGNYVIRFEVISLHFATVQGGAEFYPACTQVTVGGSQKGGPTDDELVNLPGAYSDTDPGIFVPDVYDFNQDYIFPGPPIAAFAQVETAASGGGSNNGGVRRGSTRFLLLPCLLIIAYLL